MTNDADWVEDVKRWVAGTAAAGVGSSASCDPADDGIALGYEAAHPALQARHWPDLPVTSFLETI
ncbi:MAG: hypothetical protein ABJA61_00910 [Caldimonas sp.]